MEGLDLLTAGVEAPVVVDDMVGSAPLFVEGHLGANSGRDLFFAEVVSRSDASLTDGGARPHDSHLGETLLEAVFVEQRDVVHGELYAVSAGRLDTLCGEGGDPRVQERFEVTPGPWVLEDQPAQSSPIEFTGGVDQIGAEALAYRLQARGPGLDDRPGELVGVDDPRPQLPQHARHRRLTGPYPARETEDLHGRRLQPTPLPGHRARRGGRLTHRRRRGTSEAMAARASTSGLGAIVRGGALLFSLLVGFEAAAAEPVGAARCGSCHPNIYASWLKSAHARSLEKLTAAQRADPSCRACHTLAPASDDPALAGVQCEACHGLGSAYSPDNVMRDPKLARLLGLVDVKAGTCRACHEGVEARLRPYDWTKMLEAVGHRDVTPSARP